VNQEAFFAMVVDALDRCRIPYMITGSVAAMLYGVPRMTNDMDVVVEISPDQIAPLLSSFEADDYYVPSAEFVLTTIQRGGSFNIIHAASASKVDLIVRRRNDFAVCEFSRRQVLPFTPGREAPVATPEDVILSKLLFFGEGRSEKHLEDVAGILRVSADRIDEPYIQSWVTRLHLQEAWTDARRRANTGR
jgi:hypothetical protein